MIRLLLELRERLTQPWRDDMADEGYVLGLVNAAIQQYTTLYNGYCSLCDANTELRNTLERLNAEVETLRLPINKVGENKC